MATLSPDELNEALRPLRLMLGAEGYGLDITADPLEIRISATESACAECLVPRTVMEPMIADMMQRSGLEGDYALRYPESHHANKLRR